MGDGVARSVEAQFLRELLDHVITGKGEAAGEQQARVLLPGGQQPIGDLHLPGGSDVRFPIQEDRREAVRKRGWKGGLANVQILDLVAQPYQRRLEKLTGHGIYRPGGGLLCLLCIPSIDDEDAPLHGGGVRRLHGRRDKTEYAQKGGEQAEKQKRGA